MFCFAVVDDGVFRNISYSFVIFIDGSILGVNVGKVCAVVYIDVAVPCVFVDGDIVVIGDFIIIRVTSYYKAKNTSFNSFTFCG